MSVPESNEVAAHLYRLAQANRLLRLGREQGISDDDMIAGRVMPAGLDQIRGADGKIVPEAEDYDE